MGVSKRYEANGKVYIPYPQSP